MRFLENRIPPPLVLLATLIFMAILARVDKTHALQFTPSLINTIVCVLLIVAGLVIAIRGVRAFKHAQTTINPLRPNRASSLIRSDVYKISRNPMYLGMLLFTLGAASYLASLWSLLGVLFFFGFITRFQIVPEERALRDLFGGEFNDYCKRTRRWL